MSGDTERLAGAIVLAVKTAMQPRDAKIAALEQRMAELEARPSVKYAGVWTGALQYNPGDLATFDGSLWHCNASTRTKPGASPEWTLCAKKGKDGRDR